jgi:O-antigen/teichoic acid export membrane protein
MELGLRQKIAKYSFPIAITQSAHTIDHHLDKVLVGFFLGPLPVAYYTLGKQVIQFIKTPMTALGFTLSPAYNSQKAQGNPDTAAKIYESSLSKGFLLYIPAAVGIIILARPGIELIFGTKYAGAVPVLQILAVFALLQSITELTSHGLDYLGRARERSVIKVVTAVLNVLLNLALIPLIGVIGAAIATVATFSIYTLANVYIMHRELDLRVRWLLRQLSYSIAVSGIMAIPLLYFYQYISSILSLIVVVFIGLCLWSIQILYFDLVDIGKIWSVLF